MHVFIHHEMMHQGALVLSMYYFELIPYYSVVFLFPANKLGISAFRGAFWNPKISKSFPTQNQFMFKNTLVV